jgi:hypothetical protein
MMAQTNNASDHSNDLRGLRRALVRLHVAFVVYAAYMPLFAAFLIASVAIFCPNVPCIPPAISRWETANDIANGLHFLVFVVAVISFFDWYRRAAIAVGVLRSTAAAVISFLPVVSIVAPCVYLLAIDRATNAGASRRWIAMWWSCWVGFGALLPSFEWLGLVQGSAKIHALYLCGRGVAACLGLLVARMLTRAVEHVRA